MSRRARSVNVISIINRILWQKERWIVLSSMDYFHKMFQLPLVSVDDASSPRWIFNHSTNSSSITGPERISCYLHIFQIIYRAPLNSKDTSFRCTYMPHPNHNWINHDWLYVKILICCTTDPYWSLCTWIDLGTEQIAWKVANVYPKAAVTLPLRFPCPYFVDLYPARIIR